MIQLVRIDDRLLHGQVAYSWRSKLNYDAIIIANDKVSLDEFRKAAIKMCCPENVKLAIRSLDDAIELLKNEKLKTMNVFVILENIKDSIKLYENIDENPILNIGGLCNKDESKLISKGTYITMEEEKILGILKGKNVKIEFQLVPNDDKKYF
ncbi:PTS sugar transporter subunit IIB [Oceanivirga salmonicida]|uniref:PTS sugar transporter subunit IIB n=1 Tax=Oceanivirga salmonicida TaxID=1769291 RepID=UPI00082CAE70|nr:PTS sugar transporter subunit IIB [Oceanivirga salmonicida]